ncbi:uncharacterized mitochondrial protein-like protein [Tanacetum coccineum]
MRDEFEMSMMGELNFFLGLQIKQMEDGIFFNQSKYIKEMLKKFSLKDSKPIKTLMSSDTKLTKDEECESVDSTQCRGMIGSLLYLTASRPDIMFSVCLCARFQEDPKTSLLEAVKRIFQYIKVEQAPKPKGVLGRPRNKVQLIDDLEDVDVHRGPVREGRCRGKGVLLDGDKKEMSQLLEHKKDQGKKKEGDYWL